MAILLLGLVTLPFGRALEWHSRGQRFDPAYLHQSRALMRKRVVEALLFMLCAAPNPRIKSYQNKVFLSRPGVRL